MCPWRARASGRCPASHTFTARSWSSLPVTMRLPSGLNATLQTAPRMSLEGEEFLAACAASHTLAVLVLAAGDDALAVGAERHAA